MNRKILIAVQALAVTLLVSSFAFASGGYNGGGYSNGGFGTSSSNQPRQAKPVDQDYELGKSIYKGRQEGIAAIKYCLQVEGEAEAVKLKSRSIKLFKRESYDALAGSLVDCEQPGTLVSDRLDADSLQAVMYYLSKRYDLYLTSS